MALPADFAKIFGSTFTGGLVPISDVNYSKGWEYVGSNPPTKNDFSYLQNFSDLKAQWLYSYITTTSNAASRVVGNGGPSQIPDMSFWGSPTGGLNFPNGAQIRQGVVQTAGVKTFSTPFTNACFAIVFSTAYGVNNWVFSPGHKDGTLTKTGFEFIHMCYSGVTIPQVAGEKAYYIAIGY